MSDSRRGIAYGVAAYGLWGLFPLYWPHLKPAGAIEILAQRVLWSLLVVGVVAVLTRRAVVRDRRALGMLAVAAVLIAVNWGTYIWGVNHHHVVETSLGYFVNPLVSVLLAVVVLGERLRRVQWGALALAGVAVAVLGVDYGHVPWIALTLAVSFGTYGLLKKQVGVGAVEGLVVEIAVLAPVALAYVLATPSTFAGHGAGHAALVASAGPITAVPLLLFAGAARRTRLSTLGLLQYLAPTIQFAIGVLADGEPMPPVRIVGFVLVWIALASFTLDAFAAPRRARRAAPVQVPA